MAYREGFLCEVDEQLEKDADSVIEKLKMTAGYIFAAATHPNHRKKGYMSALLDTLSDEKYDILILRPADDSLVTFYEKAGYHTFSAQDYEKRSPLLNPLNEYLKLCEIAEKSDDKKFTVMSNPSFGEINNIYFPFSMP